MKKIAASPPPARVRKPPEGIMARPGFDRDQRRELRARRRSRKRWLTCGPSPRVLFLAFGVLLGSASTSDAITYEVSWVDIRFEPDPSSIAPQFLFAAGCTASSACPVTVTGSLLWDSATQQVTAGLNPYLFNPDYALFDPNYWTMTGPAHSPLLYTWRSGLLSGETSGVGGLGAVDFLTLSAPNLFPDFIVGTYDAAALTPGYNFFTVNDCGGPSGGCFSTISLPVSGEIRVAAVPEPPTWLMVAAGVAVLIAAGYGSRFAGGRY